MAGPARAVPSSHADVAPAAEDGHLPVIIRTADPAGAAARIEAVGGRVTWVFRNLDAVSAEVPAAAVRELAADPAVQSAQRQRLVHRAIVPTRPPVPASYARRVRAEGEVVPLPSPVLAARTVSLAELSDGRLRDGEPASFFGYDVLTGAAESWEATGYGEGVIVSIIDSGVFSGHPMIAGNVIGGMNLVPQAEEEALDLDGDGMGDGRSFDWDAVNNNGHGTLIAGMIAGHVELTMPEDDPFLQSVAIHSPESVEFDGAGNATMNLMGTAPGASLYGVKVFPYNGGSAPDARVAEAIDRLIDLKRDGTLDTDVINMSLSGPVLHDGWNPLDQMVDAATAAGITVCSATSNDGPALWSTGSPASAFTGLAVGGVNDPIHTRVAIDFFTETPGLGAQAYPHEMPIPADFASRGPTADRRVKPSLVATAFFVFSSTLVDTDGDFVNDTASFGFATGTSLSTPTVSGAAALVTAYGKLNGRDARAPGVGRALLAGAVPIADHGQVSAWKQGHGFVNVPNAIGHLGQGRAAAVATVNADPSDVLELDLHGGAASGVSGPVAPGGSFDFLVNVPRGTTNLRVTFDDVQLSGSPNPIFGDGVEAAVHTAKRGGSGDYVFFKDGVFDPLLPGDGVEIPFPEPGRMRITIVGPFTNWGEISAAVSVEAERDRSIPVSAEFAGVLTHGGVAQHTVDVPDGLGALAVRLGWRHDWSQFPTYDLDLFIQGPDGLALAASLDSPEQAWLEAPTGGEYTFTIVDFATIDREEPYELKLAFVPVPAEDEARRTVAAAEAARPRIVGALPNPARGASEIAFTTVRQGPAEVTVFDVAGRVVRTLATGTVDPGRHVLRWDGRTDAGAAAAGGVYFLRLTTPEGASVSKVTLVR